MSELLKTLCPLELVKTLGKDAVWMFNQAKKLREIEIVNLDGEFLEEWNLWAGTSSPVSAQVSGNQADNRSEEAYHGL